MDSNYLTVPQKLAKIMLDLRTLRPFYSGVYEVLEKESASYEGAFSFTASKLYYNEKNMETMEYSELLFGALQIVATLALSYFSRQQGRDPKIWNIAYTLYINKLLATEFQISAPGETVSVENIEITMPKNALFSNEVDLEKDFVEKLYADFMNMQEGLKGEESSGSEEERELQELLESGDSGSTISMMEFLDEQEENDDATETLNQKGGGSPKNDGEQVSLGEEKEETEGDSEEGEERSSLTGNLPPDVTENDDALLKPIDSFEDQLEKERQDEKFLKEAQTRAKLLQESMNIGSETCLLQREVEKYHTKSLDWRTLLRQYLRNADPSDVSFASPDKRFFYQKMILPGVTVDEELCDVKLCIDTSGSVTDVELATFLGQVHHLCKKFKISAQLIYWDTEIKNMGDFQDYKQIEQIKGAGGGGTDPSCLFDYFESKACKIKPIVTLIFTDGYVGNLFEKPKRNRRFKNTIWVMSQNHNPTFQPAFGKIARQK